MGKAVPEQHPAVVLRSHYNHLRALVIAALIAVLGLAGAVVIVANDDDTVVSTSTPAIENGGTGATGVPQAEAGVSRHDIRMDLQRLRAGGVTSQGSADVTMSPPIGASSVLSQTGPYLYDGGPNEGSADVTTDSGNKAPVMPRPPGFRFPGM